MKRPDRTIREIETIMKKNGECEKVRYFFLDDSAKWWHITKTRDKPVIKERIKKVEHINWGMILILASLLGASIAFNIVMLTTIF